MTAPKFIARNASAAILTGYVTGNPVNTRLESGVGNCFPGLEFDLRNLERRFFPFLAVDFIDNGTIEVVAVDTDRAAADPNLTEEQNNIYGLIAADVGNDRVVWRIDQIDGDFGSFEKSVTIAKLNAPNRTGTADGLPPDAWTAVRLLPEDNDITITLGRFIGARTQPEVTKKLTGKRVRYLNETGAFAEIFAPGELSQSLCSPWTHDFRDCGCFYWASNHPDIALPPIPAGLEPSGGWNQYVPWERRDRGMPETPSAPATASGRAERAREMNYLEINARWPELDIVVEGRELRHGYRPAGSAANALKSRDDLILHLRYAAGVELAAIQAYIAAAYSLNLNAADSATLSIDVTTAHAEVMRVAISEMRHLRLANDVLRQLHFTFNLPGPFKPALQIASAFPASGAKPEPFAERALTPDTLAEFIAIEKPSDSVDGLYGRIVKTLEDFQLRREAATIRSVMADGMDHYETFLDVQVWLSRHPDPSSYLLPVTDPGPDNALHRQLQDRYRDLIVPLRDGYVTGVPQGKDSIEQARTVMFGALQKTCEDHAANNILVKFEPLTDDDFKPIDPPDDLKQ
jgi:hypothetical protein